jgi:hypothetical protein
MTVKINQDGLDHAHQRTVTAGMADVIRGSENTLMSGVIVVEEMIEDKETINAIAKIVVTVIVTIAIIVMGNEETRAAANHLTDIDETVDEK